MRGVDGITKKSRSSCRWSWWRWGLLGRIITPARDFKFRNRKPPPSHEKTNRHQTCSTFHKLMTLQTTLKSPNSNPNRAPPSVSVTTKRKTQLSIYRILEPTVSTTFFLGNRVSGSFKVNKNYKIKYLKTMKTKTRTIWRKSPKLRTRIKSIWKLRV